MHVDDKKMVGDEMFLLRVLLQISWCNLIDSRREAARMGH